MDLDLDLDCPEDREKGSSSFHAELNSDPIPSISTLNKKHPSTKKDVGISKHNLPCSESENDKNQHIGVYIGSMGKPSIEDISLYRKKNCKDPQPLLRQKDRNRGSDLDLDPFWTARIGSGSRS